jgi:hypothetical protein
MLEHPVQPEDAFIKRRQVYHTVAQAADLQRHAHPRGSQAPYKCRADTQAKMLAIHLGA